MSENTNENTNHDLGHKIGETVRTALKSGDLSRLKDIGTAVEETVRMKPKQAPEKNKAQAEAGGENNNNKAEPAQHTPLEADTITYGKSNTVQKKATANKVFINPNRRLPGLRQKNAGVAPFVLGVAGISFFGIATLSLVLMSTQFNPSGIVTMLAQICGFGTLFSVFGTVGGSKKMKLNARLRKYCLVLEKKPVITFEELSIETGIEISKIKKDVKKGLKKGLLSNVRYDVQETTLMYGEDVYALYLESEENRKQRQEEEDEQARLLQNPQTADIAHFKTEGAAMLNSLRAANNAIAAEDISAKISTLENTTVKIFGHVEKHPQKLPEASKFMEYYLPTTVKLIDKYRQYEINEVQVKSVIKAKKEIDDALDTINHAFVNLLDNLYAEDTLDVSTDISVLQTMLAQEGLTGKKFKLDSEDE